MRPCTEGIKVERFRLRRETGRNWFSDRVAYE
ncbi:hypothetical protein E2C01_099457 [Portunus trituberculatus]|uniref:Uncharacterized protein n=1 Tax=Portunus trituberculatus TaxID=210409 RepID=A0A5B7K5I9_PORTR|nr:hypothetical protein [Portunus trituberculatus]